MTKLKNKIVRIIDGKRYSTETATIVAYCGSKGYTSTSDFAYHNTSLFVTPKGNWFLAGEGGALSPWAQSCDNNGSCGGSGVRPLSPTEALDELERRNEVEAIERYFPDLITDA